MYYYIVDKRSKLYKDYIGNFELTALQSKLEHFILDRHKLYDFSYEIHLGRLFFMDPSEYEDIEKRGLKLAVKQLHKGCKSLFMHDGGVGHEVRQVLKKIDELEKEKKTIYPIEYFEYDDSDINLLIRLFINDNKDLYCSITPEIYITKDMMGKEKFLKPVTKKEYTKNTKFNLTSAYQDDVIEEMYKNYITKDFVPKTKTNRGLIL